MCGIHQQTFRSPTNICDARMNDERVKLQRFRGDSITRPCRHNLEFSTPYTYQWQPMVYEAFKSRTTQSESATNQAVGGAFTCMTTGKHNGRLRMFFNPLSRAWWGWWTCCGCGGPAADVVDLLLP